MGTRPEDTIQLVVSYNLAVPSPFSAGSFAAGDFLYAGPPNRFINTRKVIFLVGAGKERCLLINERTREGRHRNTQGRYGGGRRRDGWCLYIDGYLETEKLPQSILLSQIGLDKEEEKEQWLLPPPPLLLLLRLRLRLLLLALLPLLLLLLLLFRLLFLLLLLWHWRCWVPQVRLIWPFGRVV